MRHAIGRLLWWFLRPVPLAEAEREARAVDEAQLLALHRRMMATLGLAADCPSGRGGS